MQHSHLSVPHLRNCPLVSCICSSVFFLLLLLLAVVVVVVVASRCRFFKKIYSTHLSNHKYIYTYTHTYAQTPTNTLSTQLFELF